MNGARKLFRYHKNSRILKRNRPYFYSQPDGFYDLRVDEDAKSLGIANTDIKILDAAISLLEENKDC